MKRSSCLIGIVSLALAHAVSAAVTPTYVTTATQGKWCNSASSVQAAANKNNIPVVMILTMTGCAYCAGFNGHVFTTEAFQNWSTSSKYYLCRVQAVAGNFTTGEPKVAVAWTGGGDAPRIMAYWKKKDTKIWMSLLMFQLTRLIRYLKQRIEQSMAIWHMDSLNLMNQNL